MVAATPGDDPPPACSTKPALAALYLFLFLFLDLCREQHGVSVAVAESVAGAREAEVRERAERLDLIGGWVEEHTVASLHSGAAGDRDHLQQHLLLLSLEQGLLPCVVGVEAQAVSSRVVHPHRSQP